MADSGPRPEPDEFRAGWPVVFAGLVGTTFSAISLFGYTLSVFTHELVKTFGWTRSEIQFSVFVSTIASVIFTPIVGVLVNRFGARPVVLVSQPVLAVAFLGFAFLPPNLLVFYLVAFLMNAVGAATTPVAFARAINGWFDRRKGLAIAIGIMGTGLFGIVSIPLTYLLIGRFGWRGAYAVLAALPLVAWGVSLLFLRQKEPAAIVGKASAAVELIGRTTAQALRDHRFWFLFALIGIVQFSTTGVLLNMPTMLQHGGLTLPQVIAVSPILGLAMMVGRLIGGWLIDRFWAPYVGIVFLVLLGTGLATTAMASLTPALAMMGLAFIGLSQGVEYDLSAFLVARYFGPRAYGSIFGFVVTIGVLGAGLAPVIYNLVFERTGSYGGAVYTALAGLTLLVVGLPVLFGPYRYPSATAAKALFEPKARLVEPMAFPAGGAD